MTPEFTVYFAGEIFDHKDLVGNALLASHIAQVSNRRYRCVLPQDLEQTSARAAQIRNQDLKKLMECDLAIFNFDGTELDSGTVVEFMYAKMLDTPCVILRSDFRRSGDQNGEEERDGDDWNLMASFYPRTRKLQFDAMKWYQEERAESGELDEAIGRLYRRISTRLVEELDQVRAEASILKGSAIEMAGVFKWALRFPGGGLSEAEVDVDRLVRGKIDKGILRPDG